MGQVCEEEAPFGLCSGGRESVAWRSDESATAVGELPVAAEKSAVESWAVVV
jgi:hypothetical protein